MPNNYCEFKKINCPETVRAKSYILAIEGIKMMMPQQAEHAKAPCSCDDERPSKPSALYERAEFYSRRGAENICSVCRANVQKQLDAQARTSEGAAQVPPSFRYLY